MNPTVIGSASRGGEVQLKETAKAQEAGHSITVTALGVPRSRCHNPKVCDNELGQLGRSGNPSAPLPIKLLDDNSSDGSAAVASHAYVGGFTSSGHSALLDTKGNLWLSGCDRWQQLGLGSSNGGSSGYTWKGGKLWQDQFQKNEHVVELLQRLDPSLGNNNKSQSSNTMDLSRRWIRDVSLGGDHTIILSSNKRDVITCGKGGEGQLGLSSKPWVSAPAKSKLLSSSKADISSVCAFRNCSMTLDADGEVLGRAGKCSLEFKGVKRALETCRKRARETGLSS